MKRLLAVFLIVTALVLSSCSSYTYTLIHYENEALMEAALGFDMKPVPGLDTPVSFAAADGELGEVTYAFADETAGEATLVFRMSTPDYAEKYSKSNGVPGIAPLPAECELTTERLGSASVTYYRSGKTVFAAWTLGEYAFSAALTYNSAGVIPGYDELYPFVLAVIST